MEYNVSNHAKIFAYIDRHPAAVLGTLNTTGDPQGAVIYVSHLQDTSVCFITKNLTQKYKDILAHPQVSLTFFDESDTSTLQAGGRAYVISDPALIDRAMANINKIHAMRPEWLPPISKLRAGQYVLVGVELTHARLAQFAGKSIGSEQIFTEL